MRKKLSEERKQELRDQLTKARSKRAPAEYKNIYPSVLAKPDDDSLSLKSIKKWIKHNKEKAAAYLTNSRRRGASPKQVIQDKIKKAARDRTNELLPVGTGVVKDVFFSEFIIK